MVTTARRNALKLLHEPQILPQNTISASSLTLKKLIDKVNVLGFYLTAEKQIPGIKIIHHVLIYEVPLHVITDICHTTP